jgi:hypothetical protein
MEDLIDRPLSRKEFSQTILKAGMCTCALMLFPSAGEASDPASGPRPIRHHEPTTEDIDFIANWLNDLLDTMEATLDRETQIKMIEGCGRGCFNRHKFKQDIAQEGKGDLDKLVKAYDRNFEIWKDGNTVHVRYGKVSQRCYCPVANRRPAKENDIFCECTRMTHQTVFETALGKPVRVEVAESLRRGGKTCHFVVYP